MAMYALEEDYEEFPAYPKEDTVFKRLRSSIRSFAVLVLSWLLHKIQPEQPFATEPMVALPETPPEIAQVGQSLEYCPFCDPPRYLTWIGGISRCLGCGATFSRTPFADMFGYVPAPKPTFHPVTLMREQVAEQPPRALPAPKRVARHTGSLGPKLKAGELIYDRTTRGPRFDRLIAPDGSSVTGELTRIERP